MSNSKAPGYVPKIVSRELVERARKELIFPGDFIRTLEWLGVIVVEDSEHAVDQGLINAIIRECAEVPDMLDFNDRSYTAEANAIRKACAAKIKMLILARASR